MRLHVKNIAATIIMSVFLLLLSSSVSPAFAFSDGTLQGTIGAATTIYGPIGTVNRYLIPIYTQDGPATWTLLCTRGQGNFSLCQSMLNNVGLNYIVTGFFTDHTTLMLQSVDQRTYSIPKQ